MRCGGLSNAAAAPATVCGERHARSHWESPGRRHASIDPRARRPAVIVASRTGRGALVSVPDFRNAARAAAESAPLRRESAPEEGPMRAVAVHVCTTCRREGDDPDLPRPGERLREALAGCIEPGSVLVAVECLGNCKRACTVALSAAACWTYVFGDLTPDSAKDVVAASRLLASSVDGLMPWRGRPEAFKRGMIARIPPLSSLQDAAE
jgi:predicted metal-binding protein